LFQVSSVDITSSFSKTKTNVNFKRITIIVGPNNSGKSILLKDIEEYFDIQNPCFKIFENLEISISQNVDEYEKFVKDILEFEDKQIRIFIDDEF
jgi:predicted ATP-binding protein involved in virulence